MPITSSEVQFRLSGGASNTDTNASLGGVISSTEWTSTLFDNVSAAESLAGSVEYRCIYVANTNTSLDMIDAKVWIQDNTPSTTTSIAIGAGSSAVGETEQTVVNESTAPTAVSFTEPVDAAGAISLGTIPAQSHKAVWLRRTVNANTVAITDTFTLQVRCETNP